jgi:chaperonin GroES
MARAGKKDVLAAGGSKMVIAGGIGESDPLRNVSKEGRDDTPIPAFEKPVEPKMEFIPKNGHILVRRDTPVEAKGLVELVQDEAAKEKPAQGIVLETNCVDYVVGTRVVFGKYSGTEFKLNGELLLIMRDEDVQGLLVQAEPDSEVEIEILP